MEAWRNWVAFGLSDMRFCSDESIFFMVPSQHGSLLPFPPTLQMVIGGLCSRNVKKEKKRKKWVGGVSRDLVSKLRS